MTRKNKVMPLKPDQNMINAAYNLIETMPKGTDERHKKLVAAVWEAMTECAPPSRTTGLTRRQMQVHEVIADYIEEHGTAPTYKAICAQTGMTKSQLCGIIYVLRQRGVLTFREHYKQSIQLLVSPGEEIPKLTVR